MLAKGVGKIISFGASNVPFWKNVHRLEYEIDDISQGICSQLKKVLTVDFNRECKIDL